MDLLGSVTASFPSGLRPPPTCPLLTFGATDREPSEAKLLLSYHWRLLLASLLPGKQRDNWELLFNSEVHGKSYSSFHGRVTARGPTLLVVRQSLPVFNSVDRFKLEHTLG